MDEAWEESGLSEEEYLMSTGKEFAYITDRFSYVQRMKAYYSTRDGRDNITEHRGAVLRFLCSSDKDFA